MAEDAVADYISLTLSIVFKGLIKLDEGLPDISSQKANQKTSSLLQARSDFDAQ
jgi:hypothetical protein